jgi:hydrogenase expression/formation protein HypE
MKRHDDRDGQVLLSHGDGGALTRELVSGLFRKYFRRPELEGFPDAASLVLKPAAEHLALTTDAFVVSPLFFPGGDIGCLSIWGTVNDLAVSGAKPLWIAASFVLEEGLDLSVLERAVQSMSRACTCAGVDVVAGDTKVVERGKADGLYITTTGLGRLLPGLVPGRRRALPGDCLLISGTLGEHGAAVLAARFGFLAGDNGPLKSDCADLSPLAGLLWEQHPKIRLMRDLTRGGLAAAAEEVALSSGAAVWLEETALPIRQEVLAVSELLGVDPLYLACEGRLLAVVAPEEVDDCLRLLRSHPLGAQAVLAGEVRRGPPEAYLRTTLGGTRFLDLPAGGPLPRIC